jgi:hypothetical protein
MAVHIASRRVMEKAGLALARTFHQPWPYVIDGDEHGDVEYALSKAGWEHQEATGHGGVRSRLVLTNLTRATPSSPY